MAHHTTAPLGTLVQPDIVETQLSGAGNVTINKYRADAMVPLPLVELPGRQGISISLTALYASNVQQAARYDNAQAPTSILGLGWSLPRERILVLGKRTLELSSGELVFEYSGKLHPLLLVDDTAGVHRFATVALPLWTFSYDPAAERWIVDSGDGQRRHFGGLDGPGACEWGLAWNGWIGASVAKDPQRYAVAWNLVRVDSPWGEVLSYTYLVDELPVGTVGSYTRATYVQRISDALGQAVELIYEDKERFEWVSPHVRADGTPDTAYQDRYETKALASIIVYSNAQTQTEQRRLHPTYDFIRPADATDDHLTKRILRGIAQTTDGIELEPTTRFEYERESTAPWYGTLTELLSPTGATSRFEYGVVTLNAQHNPHFDKSLSVSPPEGFAGAQALTFSTAAYVVLLWIDVIGGRSTVQIYGYGGAWAQPWLLPEPIMATVDPAAVLFAQTQDKVAIYLAPRTLVAGASVPVLLFDRDTYQSNAWRYSRQAITLQRTVASNHASLVAGHDFFALSLQGQPRAHVFDYSENDWSWQRQPIDLTADEVVLAVGGERLLVGTYGHQTQRLDLLLYGRDPQRGWTRTSGPLTKTAVEWNEGYYDTLLTAGSSFGAATYRTTTAAELWLQSWSVRGVFAGDRVFPADAKRTQVVDAVVQNGDRIYRFDAGRFVTITLGAVTQPAYAVGDDFMLRTSTVGSPSVTLVRYDPNAGQWKSELLPGANGKRYAPTLSGDVMTAGTKVFRRQPDMGWLEIAELSASGEPASLVNRGQYIGYTEPQLDGSNDVIVLLLGEQGKVETKRFPAQINFGEHGGISAAGGASLRAFVTYPDHVDPLAPTELVLHRILDNSLDDRQDDVVVAQLSTSDGYQQYHTRYEYRADTALPDPSGRVVQYPEVTEILVNDQGEDIGGRVITRYYNGLPIPDPALDAFHSLLGGQEFALESLTREGLTIYRRCSAWTPVQLAHGERSEVGVEFPAVDMKVATLTATDALLRLFTTSAAEASSLDQGIINPTLRAEFAAAGIPLATDAAVVVVHPGESWVIESDGRSYGARFTPLGRIELTSELSRTRSQAYDEQTGALVSQSVAQQTTTGTEIIDTQLRYAWRVPAYRGMLEARRFDAVAETRMTNQRRGITIASSVTTWTDQWSNPDAPYDNQGTYEWNGDGEVAPEFDFSDPSANSQWIRVNAIRLRNARGEPLAWADAQGVISTQILDRDGLRQVATFRNATALAAVELGQDDPQASYCGFEDYEADGPWTTTNGEPLAMLVNHERAHTGQRSLRLGHAPGSAGLSGRFAVPRDAKAIAINLWLLDDLSDPQQRSGTITVTFDTGDEQRFELGPTGSRWARMQRALVPPSGATSFVVVLSSATAAADAFIDDLMVLPLPAATSVQVQDVPTRLVTATLDGNGATARSYFDEALRSLAMTNASGALVSLESGGFSRMLADDDRFDRERPNTNLAASGQQGGSFQTFLDDAWQRDWAPTPTEGWQVQPASSVAGQLRLFSAGGRLRLVEALEERAALLRMYASPPSGGWQAPFGVRITALGAVQWNPQHKALEVCDDAGTVVASTPQDELSAAEWIVMRQGTRISLLLDGQPRLWADLERDGGDALEVYAEGDPGLTIRGLGVLLCPQVTIACSDAAGSVRQTQVLLEDGLEASAQLKDALGRGVIATKTVRYLGQGPGYRPTLVTGLDWHTGLMRGDVTDYYDGRDGRSNDDGYPYARDLLEQAAVDRKRASGQPGRVHALRPGNAHIQELTSIVNVRGDLSPELPLQAFLGSQLQDADGARTRSFTADASQEFHRRFIAPERHGSTTTASSRAFDPRGFLAKMFPPASAQTGGERFVQSITNDALGNVLETYGSDTGQTRIVYDPLSRPRFLLLADGEGVGASGQDRLVYLNYDPLGRVLETGTIDFPWDRAVLQELARTDWPRDGAWVSRVAWDFDPDQGSDPRNGIGQQVTLSRIQPGGAVWHQHTVYDANGLVLETREQGREGVPAPSQRYLRNAAGAIVEMSFAAAEHERTVCYAYDLLGRVTLVGDPTDPRRWAAYAYDAEGLTEREVLNPSGTQPIARVMRYNSLDLLTSASCEPLVEQVAYWETEGADGATYYEGQVALASFAPASRSGLAVDRWSNAYDRAGNLAAAHNLERPSASFGLVSDPICYDANDNVLAVYDAGIERVFELAPGTNRIATMLADGAPTHYTFSAGGNLVESSRPELATLAYELTDDLVTTITDSHGRTLEIGYGEGDQRTETRWRGPDGSPLEQTQYQRTEGGGVLSRTTSAGAMIYIPGPFGPVAVLDDAGRTGFMVRDRMGSTRMVVDDAGTVLAGFAYKPFGGMSQHPVGEWADRIHYLFIGQELDPQTGLYNLNARLYDPVTCRFVSPDPLRSTASPYVYVSNNPFQASDPSGLLAFLAALAIGALVGAVIGGGASALTYAAQHDWTIDNWGDFWKEVGIGAAVGLVTGALGVATGGGATAGLVAGAARIGGRVAQVAATTGGRVAIGATAGMMSGAATGVTGQVVDNAIRGEDLSKNLGWATLTGAGLGLVLGGATSAFYFPGPRGPRINTPAGGDRYAARLLNAGNAVRNPLPAGHLAGIQTRAYVTWRDMMKLAPRGANDSYQSTGNLPFGLKYRSINVPRTGGGAQTHFEVRMHGPDLNPAHAGFRGGRYFTAKISYGNSNASLNNSRNLLSERGNFLNAPTNAQGQANAALPETHIRFRFWSWT